MAHQCLLRDGNMLCIPVFHILTGFIFKYFLFRDSYLSF